jgi:hypothetical protein
LAVWEVLCAGAWEEASCAVLDDAHMSNSARAEDTAERLIVTLPLTPRTVPSP